MRDGIVGLKLLVYCAGLTLFAACGSVAKPEAPTASNTPMAATKVPSATPEPPPRILIWSASPIESGWRALVARTAKDWALERSWLYEMVSGSAEGISLEDADLVLTLGPVPDAELLAEGHPDLFFIAVGHAGLQPQSNLAVVGEEGLREDRLAFMAGFLAALVTEDWRIGAVVGPGEMPAESLETAFSSGVMYFCGLCRPAYPPFYEYPQAATLQGADPGEMQTALEALESRAVETVYLNEGAMLRAQAQQLAASRFGWIVSAEPPAWLEGEALAIVRFDLENAIRTALETWVDGGEGQSYPLQVVIEVLNEQVVTPGREKLAREVLADLMDGAIDTGVDLSQESANP